MRWDLGPLSWRAHRISARAITGGVYWRDRIVWTLTYWGITR